MSYTAFPTDSVIQRVARESVLIVGGPATLALQVAHPVVARGVAEFSDFQARPFRRLFRTLHTVYSIVFGTATEAEAIGQKMVSLHRDIAGPGYSGMDPAAQLWVLATLMKSSIDLYEWSVGPLSDSEKDIYFAQMLEFGGRFGLGTPTEPHNWASFMGYYDEMTASGKLGSESVCRDMTQAIVRPKQPLLLKCIAPITRAWVTEPIPAALHPALGLQSTRWTRGCWRVTRRCMKVARFLPKPLRWVPHYRKLRRRLKRSPCATSPTEPRSR